MAPDINSLPPNRHSPTTTTTTTTTTRASRPSTAISSTHSSPRLSASAHTPTYADPHHYHHHHHQRTPSLGVLHQELEEEQEAQVNRLLGMIRQQQATIAEMSHQHRSASASREREGEEHVPHAVEPGTGEPPTFASTGDISSTGSIAVAGGQGISRRSQSSSRSRQATPWPPLRDVSLSRRSSAGSPGTGEERDEVAVMVAEREMVRRENRMLKGRIRELERMVAEARGEQGSER